MAGIDNSMLKDKKIKVLVFGCVVPICVILLAFSALATWFFYSTRLIETLVAEGDNFKVYEYRYEADDPSFKVKIYDSAGELINEAGPIYYRPTVIQSDDLIAIRSATGFSFLSEFYYDISSDLFSEVFPSPIRLENRLVLYMTESDDEPALIVQDKFDTDVYYKEFRFDFSPVENRHEAAGGCHTYRRPIYQGHLPQRRRF